MKRLPPLPHPAEPVLGSRGAYELRSLTMLRSRKRPVKPKIGVPKPFHAEKTPAPKRRFLVSSLVEITIEERLLTDVLTEGWRQNFYALTTAEDVAGHLAYNLIQGRQIGSLDGFADQPEDAARIVDIDVVETQELPQHELAGGALLVRKTPRGREFNWQCTCGAEGQWMVFPRQVQSEYKRHAVGQTAADKARTAPPAAAKSRTRRSAKSRTTRSAKSRTRRSTTSRAR